MTTHHLRHVGIIMDGNNRWARKRRLPGSAGHKAGVERIRDILSACGERKVDVLTVFAFSSENWQRPPKEVDALMMLFHHYLNNEAKKLKKENVRLKVIGNRQRFSEKIRKAIDSAEQLTKEGEQTLIIAADYGGRWDIAQAARHIAADVAEGVLDVDDINEQTMSPYLSLHDLPPLDLLIRTGGEQRISNFLLWQCAYAELFFSDKLWPDFDKETFFHAVDSYYHRERRFGLNGDQISLDSNASPSISVVGGKDSA